MTSSAVPAEQEDSDESNRRNSMNDLIGGDACPVCGIELDWDYDRGPVVIHPDPQCGWLPDGYPSSRRGWTTGRDPDAVRTEDAE